MPRSPRRVDAAFLCLLPSRRARPARGGRSGGPRQGATPGAVTSTSTPGAGATGTLASDEALAALREKLSGGQS